MTGINRKKKKKGKKQLKKVYDNICLHDLTNIPYLYIKVLMMMTTYTRLWNSYKTDYR